VSSPRTTNSEVSAGRMARPWGLPGPRHLRRGPRVARERANLLLQSKGRLLIPAAGAPLSSAFRDRSSPARAHLRAADNGEDIVETIESSPLSVLGHASR